MVVFRRRARSAQLQLITPQLFGFRFGNASSAGGFSLLAQITETGFSSFAVGA
jgi:hypothetical protein